MLHPFEFEAHIFSLYHLSVFDKAEEIVPRNGVESQEPVECGDVCQ